jgi:hypothetical protein
MLVGHPELGWLVVAVGYYYRPVSIPFMRMFYRAVMPLFQIWLSLNLGAPTSSAISARRRSKYISDQSNIHFRTELPYPSAIVSWGYKEMLEKQYLC